MTDYEREWQRECQECYYEDPPEGWNPGDEDIPYADDDPRLDAWLDFRRGESTDCTPYICTECNRPIPEDDDCNEWSDGSGFICDACCAKDDEGAV
jgi:hypothetical protein